MTITIERIRENGLESVLWSFDCFMVKSMTLDFVFSGYLHCRRETKRHKFKVIESGDRLYKRNIDQYFYPEDVAEEALEIAKQKIRIVREKENG